MTPYTFKQYTRLNLQADHPELYALLEDLFSQKGNKTRYAHFYGNYKGRTEARRSLNLHHILLFVHNLGYRVEYRIEKMD